MPFQNRPARAFADASIRRNAPESSGVYGLSNATEWLLIGEADNIRARLLEHLGEYQDAHSKNAVTGFSFELCPLAGRAERQERLVLELHPLYRSGNGVEPRARRQNSTYTRENS